MRSRLGPTLTGLMVALIFQQTPILASVDQKNSPGVLADGQVSLEKVGEAFSAEIDVPATGNYWFEVRYHSAIRAVDERLSPGHRPFGGAIHSAYGARCNLTVEASPRGTFLEPSSTNWVPMETVTKGSETSADRFEFKLSKGMKYRVSLIVEKSSPALQEFELHFVVEMSQALRANQAFQRARLSLTIVLWSIGLGILLVAVLYGIRRADRAGEQGRVVVS